MKPVISIIVPTYNRSRYFANTIAQVCQQSVDNFELWVVDQSDETHAQANRTAVKILADPRLHYLRINKRGVANARNVGLAYARGEIIVFLDDDVILLVDDFLKAHIEAYRDPKVGGVTGRTIERTNRENSRKTTNQISAGGRTLINLLGTEPCDIRGLKGANMSVRAEAIRGIGGFDRNYTGTALLEEADFSERIMRGGWRLRFEPNAELFHLSAPAGGVRVSNAQQQSYYRFRSTAYFIRKHRGRKGLLPFCLTYALIGAKLAIIQKDARLLPKVFSGVLDGLQTLRQGAKDDLHDAKPPLL